MKQIQFIRLIFINLFLLTSMSAIPFVYKPNTIYHIQGQFNGEMLKQYLNYPPEIGVWYNQNTHQIHLTPIDKNGKRYYKIASAFNHYFSAPNKPGEPLTIDANSEDKQLWEFIPHKTNDGRDFGFYYIKNKATGNYLYDNIDPSVELNLRQPNRGFDKNKHQSYPTTISITQPPKNDRRYLWRIDPTETEIPSSTLSVPQSGWTPKANKIAVLGVTNPLATPPSYTISDKNGNLLYNGVSILWGQYWSNHYYYILNLNIPQLEYEGKYKLSCNGLKANIFIKKDVMLHPFRQKGTDNFDLKDIFDPNFGFVTQWGRLKSWWPNAYDWLKSLSHWDWILSAPNSPHNVNTFPHWMWRDIWDDNGNGNNYENLSQIATYHEAASCLDGGWDDTDTFAHNYAIDGQTLDELAQLYNNTNDTQLHDKIYKEILYGVYPILDRQENDGSWRMGYMDKQHWSGTTAALGMGLAAVLPIIKDRNNTLALKIKSALQKTWDYMQIKKDDPQSWPVPNVGIMYDGNVLKGFVGNQRTMWREAYLMFAINLYLATHNNTYKKAVEKEILSGHFAYNGWMNKNPYTPFAGQYSTNAIFALIAMLRYYDDASKEVKKYIKKLSKYFYDTYVITDKLIGGPFGNYSKRRIKAPDGVDAWHIWEYMAASTHIYKHFGDEFGKGLLLSQRALDWYWGANPYAASLMQGVGTRFMNYGWSSPHTIGRHMGLSATTINNIPKAKGTDGSWPMSEATVSSSISIWNSIVLMQKFSDHNWTKIYSKNNFKGVYSFLTTGKYNHKMLIAYGIKDINSIKIPTGYVVKLYTGDNFNGNIIKIDNNTSNIAGTYNSLEITYNSLSNKGKIEIVPKGTEITSKSEVSQSTTLYNSSTYTAQKAVDNDVNTFSHTDLTSHGNYWQMLFNANYSIGKIKIVNRKFYGIRLNGCVLKVLDENKKTIWSKKITNAKDGGTLSFTLPENIIGRYIWVGLEGDNKNAFGDYVVTIAEMHVYAGKEPTQNNNDNNDTTSHENNTSNPESNTTAEPTEQNIDISLSLKEGWNLVSLDSDIHSLSYPIAIIWKFKNNQWQTYSPLSYIQKILEHIPNITKINNITNKEGIWIYAEEPIDINYTKTIKIDISYLKQLPSGWSLNGTIKDTSTSYIECKDENVKSIWKFKNNTWYINSNLKKFIDLNIENFDTIKANEGFWVNCL